MRRIVEISSPVLAAIQAAASADSMREICGLLFGDRSRIVDHLPCDNVSPSPADSFEIDPAALIAAYRMERAGGRRIVGCYHSHPTGDASPSRRDAADAVTADWLWLIVGGGLVRGWRVVPGGERHDRFDPVDLCPIR